MSESGPEINVTREMIDEARARGMTGSEFIALAIKKAIPEATDIEVTLETISYSLPGGQTVKAATPERWGLGDTMWQLMRAQEQGTAETAEALNERRAIEAILDAIQERVIESAVLARELEFELEEAGVRLAVGEPDQHRASTLVAELDKLEFDLPIALDRYASINRRLERELSQALARAGQVALLKEEWLTR